MSSCGGSTAWRAAQGRSRRLIVSGVCLALLSPLLTFGGGGCGGAHAADGAGKADAGAGKGQAAVESLSIAGDEKRTLLDVTLSDGVTVEIVTLANPYRVVIDLPRVAFRLPSDTGGKGKGLVSAYRYGLFAEGRSRIVLDVKGPVRVEKAAMEAVQGGSGVRLKASLAPMDKKAFGAGTGALKSSQPEKRPEEPAAKKSAAGKPVVVIDPGHGGIDPGATGVTSLLEKDVVLAVARRLGTALAATNRYEVQFTRSTDMFVSLSDRVALSRKYGAELFISLHADALESKNASVRGATIYTLSEKPSDEQARLRAERENASDLLAGVAAAEGEGRGEVMSILLDLMKRESSEFSADFADTLVAKLGKTVSFSRESRRSAAFQVLKQTHAPSVLIELGYMSNPEDEKLMTTPEWQGKVAQSMVTAIDAFFAKRSKSRSE